MFEKNVFVVLRTRNERTERRLKHRRESNESNSPPQPPAHLINNNHLYCDLNMNFDLNSKQRGDVRLRKKVFQKKKTHRFSYSPYYITSLKIHPCKKNFFFFLRTIVNVKSYKCLPPLALLYIHSLRLGKCHLPPHVYYSND